MVEFRVTKYDPKHRNNAGHYLLDEWTEFNDVGGSITLHEYEQVEEAYISSALDFARTWNGTFVTISGLEDHDQKTNFQEGQRVNLQEIPTVLRSMLRAEFWCRLTAEDGFIHVGYDFYMYIGAPEADQSIIDAVEERGLYVEEFASPYHPDSP